MKDFNNMTIGEIVTADYRTAAVFTRHKIDYCCKGNVSLEDACANKKVDPAVLKNDLEKATTTPVREKETGKMNASELCDYIENVHHKYVEAAIAQLNPLLDKIVAVHGGQHPELSEIKGEFQASAGELTMHMKKEELILFPAIRRMSEAKEKNISIPAPSFGSISNPIRMMEHEHTTEGDRFDRITMLSGEFTPPEGACNSYRTTFALLNEFFEDLKEHIHLENNILFPMALNMEMQLNSNSCCAVKHD